MFFERVYLLMVNEQFLKFYVIVVAAVSWTNQGLGYMSARQEVLMDDGVHLLSDIARILWSLLNLLMFVIS